MPAHSGQNGFNGSNDGFFGRPWLKEAIMNDKYECEICGYVYDPAVGDPDGGIAPGTPFEDIPDDWACPICGATKDQFVLAA